MAGVWAASVRPAVARLCLGSLPASWMLLTQWGDGTALARHFNNEWAPFKEQ